MKLTKNARNRRNNKLTEEKIKEIRIKYNFEILFLNKRVDYFKDFSDQKPSINPPFSSIYLCSNLLTKQICFAHIKKEFYNGNKLI